MINPRDTKALIAWFEEDWECFVGPPRAYFDIPDYNCIPRRFIYTTYCLGAYPPKGEVDLVSEFEHVFGQFIGKLYSKMLVWRHPEKIFFDTKQVPIKGKLLCTREQVNDGLLSPGPYAIEDFETGHWYEKVGITTEHTIYTRLCIPALAWKRLDCIGLEKAEGAAVRFI